MLKHECACGCISMLNDYCASPPINVEKQTLDINIVRAHSPTLKGPAQTMICADIFAYEGPWPWTQGNN